MNEKLYDPETAADFRRHTPKTLEVGGKTWSYLRGGSGKKPVLFLHGLLGDGYDAGSLLAAMEPEIDFVAPSIPAIFSLGELAAGLEAILDREGIGRVVLVGGSFGGILAQSFFHRRRDRVAHLLIFDSTGPQRRQGHRNQRNAWLWHYLPMFLLRSLFRLRLRFLLRASGPLDPAQNAALEFAKRRFAEKVQNLDRAQAQSQLALSVQAFLEDPVEAVSLGGWPGRVVLIAPDDMPSLATGQQILEQVFPQAEKIVTRGCGHLGSLLHPELYREALRRLLAA